MPKDTTPAKLPRYLQKRLDAMKWPQLLVLKDKHSTDYYLLTDAGALGRACLEILKARLDPRYGYIRNPGKEPYDLCDELSEEQALALPAPYRAQELKKREHNKRARAGHAEELEQHATAESALATKDGMAAFDVLNSRRDRVYEGFELVRPRVP